MVSDFRNKKGQQHKHRRTGMAVAKKSDAPALHGMLIYNGYVLEIYGSGKEKHFRHINRKLNICLRYTTLSSGDANEKGGAAVWELAEISS